MGQRNAGIDLSVARRRISIARQCSGRASSLSSFFDPEVIYGKQKINSAPKMHSQGIVFQFFQVDVNSSYEKFFCSLFFKGFIEITKQMHRNLPGLEPLPQELISASKGFHYIVPKSSQYYELVRKTTSHSHL